MSKAIAKKQDEDYESLALCAFSLVLCIVSLVTAHKLFGEEFRLFAGWWFTIFVLGSVFMPLSIVVFGKFSDCGWMFSKVIAIAVTGWMVWYLSSLKILKFTRTGCFVIIAVCLILNIVLLVFKSKDIGSNLSLNTLAHILLAEGVFIALFVLWMYIKGFNPKAYGTTEKLMDFGFMEAMFKSEYMPPEDMWLAGENLNYYYVGQFLATYITKVAGCGVEYGYNFMLMMIAAMGFSLPASIVYNVSRDSWKDSKKADSHFFSLFPYFAAGLAGIAVSFISNMHYVIYAKFIPWLRTMLGLNELAEKAGYSFPGYWFPNATRYIGYNPETEDKTIHEFPLYSYVLGDLHAHVINIIFVLTVVAVLYAYLQFRKKKMDLARTNGVLGVYINKSDRNVFGIPDFYAELFNPCILLTGFFIGLFHTTNFWDFPIYFVVAGAVILFSNCVIYDFSKRTLILTAFHAAVVLIIAKLTCLPFTINFNQISTSIMPCVNRTPLYQLAILWGLPLTVTFVFLGILIRNQIDDGVFQKDKKATVGRNSGLFRFIGNLEIPDLFILVLGLCAFGLVLIPEIIYVKDIYSGAYKRANTMFKLTYQSFILFGMTMGYVLAKLVFYAKKKKRFWFAVICIVLVLMNTGYFGNSTKAWFGNWTESEEGYKSLNAGDYLKDVNVDDYNATNWINDNIEGRPVMLEANGDSYTDYCRVSVRTGLPTLLGWRTHEWLWQSDATGELPAIVEQRTDDVQTIYSSYDINAIRNLIKKYNIEYIYVGSLEREKFGDVNEELLISLGDVVYPADFNASECRETTYIIKLNCE